MSRRCSQSGGVRAIACGRGCSAAAKDVASANPAMRGGCRCQGLQRGGRVRPHPLPPSASDKATQDVPRDVFAGSRHLRLTQPRGRWAVRDFVGDDATRMTKRGPITADEAAGWFAENVASAAADAAMSGAGEGRWNKAGMPPRPSGQWTRGILPRPRRWPRRTLPWP